MSSEIAISVRNVSKRYRLFSSPLRQLASLLLGRDVGASQAFHALSDISFDVRKGETLGIIGRNGAGKSTLLQIICGTLTPSDGEVAVHGRVAALLELGAGFNPEYTGRDNVYMSGAIYGLSRSDIEARLDDILAFAEIGEFIDQPVKTYSSGMFVRLAFAVIAHLDADILVIDEALAVGDVYFTQKCMRFLRAFAETGTLLFVSHDTHSVVNLCERAVWLEQGRVRLLDKAGLVSNAYLASFYEAQSEKRERPALADEVSGDDQTPGSALESPPADVGGDDLYAEFGVGGARIHACRLLDAHARPLHVQTHAQQVSLVVDCVAYERLESPIVGFYIKDRLGQPVCGFNSIRWVDDWQQLVPGEPARVAFSFWLPQLATGEYAITVALAAGTQEQHVQHHWIHEAIAFKAQTDPHLSGLFTLEKIECVVSPIQTAHTS